MKKFFVLILAIIITAGLIIVTGCSDDDENGTNPIVLPEGDLDDPLFLAAWYPIEDAGEQVPMGLQVMMYFLNGVLDSAAALEKGIDIKGLGVAEPDTIWYDETTKYWHAQGEGTEMYWHQYERDSAQFMHGGTAVKWPDTLLLTRINGGSYFVEMTLDDTKGIDSPTAVDTLFEYEFAGYMTGAAGAIPAMGDVTAGGLGSMRIQDMPQKSNDEIWCAYEIKDDFNAANVQLNILDIMTGGGCPDDGTIIHHADITLDCSGDTTFTHTGSWYISETFAGDSIHYIVENGIYRWDFWNDCQVKLR